MSEKYKEYCMKFSNEEIRAYMVDYLISNSMNNKLIKYLSEDGDEIQFNTSEKIGTIVFDGDDENLFINFYGTANPGGAWDGSIISAWTSSFFLL